MKYLNLFGSMNLLTLSAILLACCKPADNKPLDNNSKSDLVKAYEAATDGLNYTLVGDTTRPNVLTPLHPTTNQTANITALKAADGSFRYVAIGASLTAGVRDGGWFNDGITTAYPNLIARQMGLTDFKQPLFDDKEFNGYGQKLPTINTETPVPRFKAVGNNIAFKPQGVEMLLTPYSGSQLNNFAVPNLLSLGFYDDLSNSSFENTYYKLYLNRILKQPKNTIENQLNYSNLVTIEYYTQDILASILADNSPRLPEIYPYSDNDPYSIKESSYTGGADLIMYKLYKKDIKNMVLLNVPNVLNFPYLKNSISFSQIKNVFNKFGLTNKEYGDDLDNLTYFPNPSLDSLFKYQNDKSKFLNYYLTKFHPKGILSKNKEGVLSWINIYNQHIALLNKKYNAPIVDIATLYDKINRGILLSDDGKIINEKQFFSSDGIYPSAYGQAIIANECIKTINNFYKTTIPLIQTSYYLNR